MASGVRGRYWAPLLCEGDRLAPTFISWTLISIGAFNSQTHFCLNLGGHVNPEPCVFNGHCRGVPQWPPSGIGTDANMENCRVRFLSVQRFSVSSHYDRHKHQTRNQLLRWNLNSVTSECKSCLFTAEISVIFYGVQIAVNKLMSFDTPCQAK